ncbi:hypothetical protein HK100_010594 [Physocladia obscura]|uniref:Uncharacterized protein n=1 Tax=Physocladia obscura TaxID=109957 RepID=A0AAD5T2C8_9FUNG|nr:hypothetical protein HK100_010594 [Physocladia obscura]
MSSSRDAAFNTLEKFVRLAQQEVKEDLNETNHKISSSAFESIDTASHENDIHRSSSSQFDYYSTSNFSLSPGTESQRLSSTSEQYLVEVRNHNLTPPSSIAPSHSSYVDASDRVPELLDGFTQSNGLLDGGLSFNEIHGSLASRRTSVSIGTRIKKALSTRSRQSSSENFKRIIDSETVSPDRKTGGSLPRRNEQKRPVFWNLDGPEVDINSLRRRIVPAPSYITTPEPSIHERQFNDPPSFSDKHRSTVASSNSTAPALERRWYLSSSPLPTLSTLKFPEVNIQQYSPEKSVSKLPTGSLTDSESRANRSGFFQTFSVGAPVSPTSTSRGVILPNRRGARRIGGTVGTMAQRRRSSSLGRHNIYQEAAVELARIEKAKNAATAIAAAVAATTAATPVDDGDDYEVQSILAGIDGNIDVGSTNNGSMLSMGFVIFIVVFCMSLLFGSLVLLIKVNRILLQLETAALQQKLNTG